MFARRARGIGRAAWILGLLAGSNLATAQEQPVLEFHDLRAILTVDRWKPAPVDWRSHLRAAMLDELDPPKEPVPLESAVSAERLLGFSTVEDLIFWYLGEEWPDEGLSLTLRSEFLRARGTPASQEKIAEFLGLLERRVLRTARLEAYVLPAEVIDEEWGSVLSPDEVARLLASTTPIARSRARVPLGRIASLGASSVRAVLHDFDVEVASYCAIADPQVTIVFEGTQLGAVVRELAEGGFLLRSWGRRGFVQDPMREVGLEYLDGTKVQLPKLVTTRAAASARIEDGGGLLVGQTWNGEGVWLVTARRTEAPGAGDERWIPLAGLTARPMTSHPPWTIGPQPSGGLDPAVFNADPLSGGDRELPPPLDEEDWLALLTESLDVDDPDPRVTVIDGDLLVCEDDALARKLRERVSEWGAPRSRTAEMDLRFGLLDPEVGEAIARGELDAAELVPRLEQRLQGACRLGDSLTVQGGTEEFYLKDFDVEIAQAAMMADPILDGFFQGIAFWCYPTALSSGDLLALVELEFQEQLGDWENESVSFGNVTYTNAEKRERELPPLRAYIEVTRSTRADVSLVIRPTPGEWSLIACHSLPGTDRTFVATLRMELR